MKPTTLIEVARAARTIGRLVGTRWAAYCLGGRCVVQLPARDWSLAVSPDDAGRLRIEACHSDRVRATMWCRAADGDRLAELVSAALAETASLVV